MNGTKLGCNSQAFDITFFPVAERTAKWVRTVAYANAASVGEKQPRLQLGTLCVDIVNITEVWLHP